MQLMIFVALVTVSSAAQLPSNSYLPPTRGSGSGGGSYGSPSGGFGGAGSGNTRAQAVEKNADILYTEQEVGENGFRYTYQTSNGIRAEEAGNAERTQGVFEYKGDDGITYTVNFKAGVDGFQPEGAHLPVPPPTPQEILLALEQNAKDEAAGIFDDGLYHPEAEEGTRGRPGHSARPGSGQGFGSANREGSFNANSGYRY